MRSAGDLVGMTDRGLRDSILALFVAVNQVQADLVQHLHEFNVRGLALADGFRTTKAWLQAFARLSGPAATAQMRAVHTLTLLPQLAEAFGAGAVSLEHVNRIGLMREQLGADVALRAQSIMVDLARASDPADLHHACDHLREVVLDGRDDGRPDRTIERRGVTLSRMHDMWHLHGQLDAEAGATLRTALDAFTAPPGEGDLRTAAQRRHDALVDLSRAVLADRHTPSVAGARPHIALLMPVELYVDLHDPGPAAEKPARRSDPAGPTAGHAASRAPDSLTPGSLTPGSLGSTPGSSAAADLNRIADRTGRPEPAYLDGWGPVTRRLAERLACDATLQTILLEPVSGLPLHLGRAYRNTPPHLRKALWARDRHCRWPGCRTEANWCDSHHVRHWKHGGRTDIDNLLLLCRWHHMLVHEGRWTITFDHTTGVLAVTRPDGRPYELGPSRPFTRVGRPDQRDEDGPAGRPP